MTDIIERLKADRRKSEDDMYALNWRNKYLAARVKYLEGELTSARQSIKDKDKRIAELEKIIEPFTSPPQYVFEDGGKWVPVSMPKDWIGGGWLSTDDFRAARQSIKDKE